jgi:hypothetical protein
MNYCIVLNNDHIIPKNIKLTSEALVSAGKNPKPLSTKKKEERSIGIMRLTVLSLLRR